ncbi:MAG: hypothetical protein M0P07_04335 [Candidatus Methanomethylophilaceae archaeon]|nr:hypothetical protein [Candidatus Methanomethylophilaceae archaeon]
MFEILSAILGPLFGAMMGSFLGFFFAILLEKRSRKINAEEKLRYLIKEYSDILSDLNITESKTESRRLEKNIRYEIRNVQKICVTNKSLRDQIDKMLSDGMNTAYHGTRNPESHKQLMTELLDWSFYKGYPEILKFIEGEEKTIKVRKKAKLEKKYD